MANMDVEAEIRDLKRRVGELEGGFGFLTQQVRTVHLDLLGFQKRTEERFDKVEERLDRVDSRLDRVEGRLDRMDRRLGNVEQKVDELPRALAEVVQAEFAKRDGRSG
jgi:septal ring factor EnvC (AmiA/AmiB activator)